MEGMSLLQCSGIILWGNSACRVGGGEWLYVYILKTGNSPPPRPPSFDASPYMGQRHRQLTRERAN